MLYILINGFEDELLSAPNNEDIVAYLNTTYDLNGIERGNSIKNRGFLPYLKLAAKINKDAIISEGGLDITNKLSTGVDFRTYINIEDII